MILEQDLYKIEPAKAFSGIKELSVSHPSLKIYLQIMDNDRRDFLQWVDTGNGAHAPEITLMLL